ASELSDIESLLAAIHQSRAAAGPVLSPDAVTAQTPLEKTIAGMWQTVLGLDGIDIHADFFKTLGGDSLLGAQILARIWQEFQLPLELHDLFAAPTIAELARKVEQQLADPERDTEAIGMLAELQAADFSAEPDGAID